MPLNMLLLFAAMAVAVGSALCERGSGRRRILAGCAIGLWCSAVIVVLVRLAIGDLGAK